MLEVHTSKIRLNVGAGNKRISGYVAVDIDPATNPDVIASIDKLPYADGTVAEVLSVHSIEHVHRWEGVEALREWFRVLAPKGLLVVECPDFLKCCRNVVNGSPFNHGKLGLYGDHEFKNPYYTHRYVWDEKELMREMKDIGFQNVRAAKPQYHGRRTYRDMRVEAQKP